jgi:hypothetical protein
MSPNRGAIRVASVRETLSGLTLDQAGRPRASQRAIFLVLGFIRQSQGRSYSLRAAIRAAMAGRAGSAGRLPRGAT